MSFFEKLAGNPLEPHVSLICLRSRASKSRSEGRGLERHFGSGQ